MIQQDIYKIPITKMDLESGMVCMNHLSQIIKNKALPSVPPKWFYQEASINLPTCLLGPVVKFA